MESDLIFLEFYGLPGCGKSTVSHIVAKKLAEGGKTVSEPTYDTDHKSSAKVRKVKKFLKLFRYALIHPKKYRALKKLVSRNGYGGKNGLKQCANITNKLLAYEKAETGFVIFDEGLTQSAISLSQEKEGKVISSENEKILYGLCGNKCRPENVKKIHIRVKADVALARMEGRDVHDSRIEKMNPELRKKAVAQFHMQCDLIPDGIVIEDAAPEEVAERILKAIGTEKR